MLRVTMILMLCAGVFGCTTTRIYYSADVTLDDGQEGAIEYERSYDTTGHATGCFFTAVFYGGWCWAYYQMPHEDQEARIRHDARAYLQRKLGTNKFSLHAEYIDRRGFDNGPLLRKFHIHRSQGDSGGEPGKDVTQ